MIVPPFGLAIPLASIHSLNPVFAKSLENAHLAATNPFPVFLVGEPGVGKVTLGRAIHAASARAARPFVLAVVSRECGVVWMSAMIEKADGGTVYICDFARLSRQAQERLVVALIERTGMGIICATTRDLDEIEEGNHYYRQELPALCGEILVSVPPLRARPQDVGPLFEGFLAEAAEFLDRVPFEPITLEVLERLLEHPWPGNVRELREVAWRAAWCVSGAQVVPKDLGLDGPTRTAAVVERPGASSRESQVIRRHTLRTLRRFGGDVARVEAELGVSRATLFNRIRQYGLRLADFRPTKAKALRC